MIFYVSRVVICCALMLFESASLAGDWPTYRHDRLRTAATDEELALPLKQVWEFQSRIHRAAPVPTEPPSRSAYPYSIRYNLPMIAADGALFFTSGEDGRIVCLDAASAKTKWEFVAGAAVNRSPIYWQGRIYAGSDDGFVYCLDAESGRQKWKFQAAPTDRRVLAYGRLGSAWPVRTDIMVDEGIAYFSAGVFPHDGTFVYALDALTGEVLWRNGTQCEDSGQVSLAPGGYLYLTGKDIWVPKDFRGFSKVFYGSPTPFRRSDGVFVNAFGTAIEEDPERPKLENSIFWPLIGVKHNGVRHAGDVAWKIENEHAGRQVIWQQQVEGRWVDFDSGVGVRGKRDVLFRYDPDLCSVIRAGETIFHIALDNDPAKGVGSCVYARSAADGRLLWSVELPERANQLMVAGGRLFVGTQRGTIYCFAAESAQVHGVVEEAIDDAPFGDEETELATSAKTIVEQSGIKEGYALVLDCASGRLAYELARKTDLYVVAVFADEDAAAAARTRYAVAGMHVNRVVAATVKPGGRLPFPHYFADLMISEAAALGGDLPVDITELTRMQKPVRGIAMFGGGQTPDAINQWIEKLKLTDWQTLNSGGEWAKHTRGLLPDGGGWTHMYADAGNTACSHDAALKAPLGVAWYGPPHINQPGTHTALVTSGILVVPEPNALIACDQYTGRELWRRDFGSIGVSIAASSKHVYSRVAHVLVQLDLLTGEEKASYLSAFGEEHPWGWFAVDPSGKRVYGAAGGGLFATEMESGQGNVQWTLGGPDAEEKDRINGPMAMDDGRIYVLGGAANDEQRADCLAQMRAWMKTQPQELREEFENQIAERDIRELVAVDAATGKILFRRGVDISNCGGTWLREKGRSYGSKRHYNPHVTLGMYVHNGVVVLASESPSDKGWSVWNSGGYEARAITAYDAKSGDLLWYQFTNHRTRPVIINDTIHAEPWAFNLRTGEKQLREHPITGEDEDWAWCRSDKQCGIFSASSNFLFGRNKGFGYHDLIHDDGLYTFWHSRSNCHVDHVSGGGLMIKPPQAIYCSCQWSLPFTVAMGQVDTPPAAAPLFGQKGRTLPIKHLRLNLAGAGDRRDAQGNLWISPRAGEHWLLLNYTAPHVYYDGGGPLRRSAVYTEIAQTEDDFLFATCERGLKRLILPATTAADGAGIFKVRLGFAPLPGDATGSRVFNIRINGQTMLENFDPAAAAGEADTAVWKEFTVATDDDIIIDLVSAANSPTVDAMPILQAVEVDREEVTTLGFAAPDDTVLSKSQRETEFVVHLANLRDKPFAGRIVLTGPSNVTVAWADGDHLKLEPGQRTERVLQLSATGLDSDEPAEKELQVRIIDNQGKPVMQRTIPLEWLGKYERKIINGCTAHCVRGGDARWRSIVQPHTLFNESLWISAAEQADDQQGQSISYLDFGTLGDIGEVRRVRLRLRTCRAAEAVQQSLFDSENEADAAADGRWGSVASVEGDIPDIRQVTLDALPATSDKKAALAISTAQTTRAIADLDGPFAADTRLRLAVEAAPGKAAAFWTNLRHPWSSGENHVPQLIIDYVPKPAP